MAEQDDKLFTPILVAVLGFFGAAIAPAVQFVNGFWNYQLKQQEITHKIALDLAQLTIKENVSRKYQRDTLDVVASISGNTLETWAKTKLEQHQDTDKKVLSILVERSKPRTYKSFEECQTYLEKESERQPEVNSFLIKDIYDSQKDLSGTIQTATDLKDPYLVRLEEECKSLKNGSVNVTITKTTGCVSPQELDRNILQEIFTSASLKDIDNYLPFLREGMPKKNINTCKRMAMFLAQIGHESAAFRYKEEIASGAAYEGRKDLGNTQPGDGKRFKGRGLIQVTGRINYINFANYVSKPEILSNPSLVTSDPFLNLEAAFFYWESRKLNEVADTGDVKAVTRRINGGYNGLADRTAYYEKAVKALTKD